MFKKIFQCHLIFHFDNTCCFLKAKKLMEHRRKYERIREEKELKKRKKKIQQARAEYEKQKEVSLKYFDRHVHKLILYAVKHI